MSWIELVAQRHPPKPPAGMQPPENAKDWFRIENNADDVDSTDVYIYSSIGGWFGMWADEFIDELRAVTTSKISIRLNSPGGSVFDGIAIANAIRSHPADVTVYVDSLAASIASVIAMAGNRLVMMPQSQIMVHNASGACYGDATEMTKMADLLDKQSRNIAEAYAQHTGRPLAEWTQYMADETWFTAEEALAVGLADEVVPMKAKQAEPAEGEPVPAEARMHRAWDLSMYAYAGRENAPAPKVPVMVNTVDLSDDVSKVTEGGYSEDAQATIDSLPPGTITVDLSLLSTDERFQTAIRDLIRQEMSSTQVPQDDPPAVEDGAPQPDDSPAADTPPEDAFPPPDEDEEEEGDEPPPEEEDEPADKADDWTSVIGLLVAPATSPGADDVFSQLKEGW